MGGAERVAGWEDGGMDEHDRQALELERERVDTELAELRERVANLERYVGTLQSVTIDQLAERDRRLHSVRVEP